MNYSKKSISKISTYIIACALFIGFTSLNATAQKSNFSGNWKLDTSKVDYGRLPHSLASVEFDIIQRATSIDIKRFSIKGPSFTYPLTLTFDGKPAEAVIGGETHKTAHIEWSADGKSFTEVSNLLYKDNDRTQDTNKSTLVFTLSADGKILTLNLTMETSDNQSYQATYVYNKSK